MNFKASLTMFLMSAVVAAAVTPHHATGSNHATGSSALRFQAQAHKLNAPATPAAAPADTDKEPSILVPGQVKPLSVAMQCVMSLLFLFFLVTIFRKVIDVKDEVMDLASGDKVTTAASSEASQSGQDPADDADGADNADGAEEAKKKDSVEETNKKDKDYIQMMKKKLDALTTAMMLVPMFCILITFCRLRARVDLDTEPQPQAKLWMRVSTLALIVEILMAVFPKGNRNGETGAKILFYLVKITDLLAIIALYVGVGFICVSIFTLKYQEDKLRAA